MEAVSDSSLLKVVNERLQRSGGSGIKDLRVSVTNGIVTMVGALRFETQRRGFHKVVASIAGVRDVIDKMTLAVVKNRK